MDCSAVTCHPDAHPSVAASGIPPEDTGNTTMLARILQAIGDALKAALESMRSILKFMDFLFKRGAYWAGRATASVERAVSATAALAASAAEKAVMVPAALAGSVVRSAWRSMRGGQAEQPAAEEQAAATGARRAKFEGVAADTAADERVMLQAVRRVASARARGVRPDPEAVALLRPDVVRYLLALTPEECGRLATSRVPAVRALLDTGVAPEGVRSPSEVAADTPEPEASHPSAARATLHVVRSQARIDEAMAAMGEWQARAAVRIAA